MSRMNFADWKRAVDRAISALTGLGADDLPDWDYWTAWDSGTSPKSAARQAIRAAREC